MAPYRLLAYHAQQCAEKYIKAYLIFRNIDFPYSHNISRLLEILSEQKPLPDGLNKAEELTVYAVTTRYPGEDEEVTKNETLEAISIAENTKNIIMNLLSKYGYQS